MAYPPRVRAPLRGAGNNPPWRLAVERGAGGECDTWHVPDLSRLIHPKSLPDEDQSGWRRRGRERDVLETGLGEPGLVVLPPPGPSVLALEQHFRGERQREGRAGAVVVDDVVTDDQRAAGFESAPDLGEDRYVVLRSFLVGDVGVHRDVVSAGAEADGVEVAVDTGEPVSHASFGDKPAGDRVDWRPVELRRARGGVELEPDGRVDARSAAYVEDRDVSGLR